MESVLFRAMSIRRSAAAGQLAAPNELPTRCLSEATDGVEFRLEENTGPMENTPMPDELFFRMTLLSVYLLFAIIRAGYGVRVLRSGGKVYGSIREDAVHAGRLNSLVGLVMEFALPASALLYVINPSWVARLSFPLPAWLRVCGAALSVVSIALLVLVHRALGRHWSASLRLRDGHEIVTTGPYARVRHPMYTALFGNTLGLMLLSANWVVVLPRLVQYWRLYTRIGGEEAMMIERFGEEYRDYMERTGRLLPHRQSGGTAAP